MQKIKFWILLLVILTLSACSKEKNAGTHIITLESKPLSAPLFFAGTIQPLKTVVVTSPAEGTIIDIAFHYGDHIKQGQPLFTISSAKFLSDYKTALMQYIKAKNDFNNSQSQLQEAKFLHKNELISDDDYKMKQSNFYTSQLGLVQAKDQLALLLKQLDIKGFNFFDLSIADVDKITNALQSQVDAENLHIVASADGVALLPNKGEEEHKKWNKGDTVKQGDVLTVIGDMQGIVVHIKVNEMTINKLHLDEKIQVSGVAFNDAILDGKITGIDRQGESSGGTLPTFSVEVTVPHLKPEEQKVIHVGMSAKVEIQPDQEPQLSVPFSAITERQGNTYVKVWDEKTKQATEVPVKTGQTTETSVVILSNLKAGDKIVVPN